MWLGCGKNIYHLGKCPLSGPGIMGRREKEGETEWEGQISLILQWRGNPAPQKRQGADSWISEPDGDWAKS